MLRYCRVACLLLALCVNPALAWTIHKPRRQSQTALFSVENPSQSRRQWFSSTVTAAGVSLLPLPSNAAAKVKSSDAICDPTVSVLKKRGRIIYILGTAHISDVSAQLSAQLVKDVQPDAVFIELDLKRVGPMVFRRAYLKPDRLEIPSPSGTVIVPNIMPASKDIELPKSQQQAALTSLFAGFDFGGPAESHQALVGLLVGADLGAAAASAGIGQMYRNLSKQGFKPGEEFVVAVQEGQNIGADIILGDQDMGVTLQRLSQAAKMTDFSKLSDPNSEFEQYMKQLMPAESSDDPKSNLSTFVENIKTRENVGKVIGKLREQAPAIVQAMLDERDAYMAAGLDILNDKEVTCAVMGLAHLDGVERNLQAKGWKKVNPSCPRR